MPLTSRGSPVFIAGRGVLPTPMNGFYVPFLQPTRYRISGVTRDSAGVAIGDCWVSVYETISKRLYADGVSDSSGNYSIDVQGETALQEGQTAPTFFVVAYKAGAPDVAGTSVSTLVGA